MSKNFGNFNMGQPNQGTPNRNPLPFDPFENDDDKSEIEKILNDGLNIFKLIIVLTLFLLFLIIVIVFFPGISKWLSIKAIEFWESVVFTNLIRIRGGNYYEQSKRHKT